MQEIVGDLFDSEKADAICITTNGFVNAQGSNTMGRGCAEEAKKRWPGIQLVIGRAIRNSGNHVHLLTTNERTIHPGLGWPEHKLPYHLFTFPVKPAVVTDAEELLPRYQKQYLGHEMDLDLPGWMAKASVDLITQSCVELSKLTEAWGFDSVVVPRPGCGAGGLNWEREVRDVCHAYLDDRFYMITFE